MKEKIPLVGILKSTRAQHGTAISDRTTPGFCVALVENK